jgi:hypothetical protein
MDSVAVVLGRRIRRFTNPLLSYGTYGRPALSMEVNWRKSSYSNNTGGACVEVASDDAVLVRDTTDRGGSTLSLSSSAWSRFLGTLR